MTTIRTARPERCSLLLNEGEEVRLTWANDRGEHFVTDGHIDLASGCNGRPVPGGVWTADAVWEAGAPLFADLSGDGTLYQAALGPSEGGVALHITYAPHKASFSQKAADGALNLIYRLGRLASRKGDRFLFAGDARAKADGNAAFVLAAAERLGLIASKAVGTAYRTGGKQVAFYAKTAFRMGRSDTLVVDDYFPLLYHLKLSKGVRVFQLWHACGAFKTVGYSRAGKPGGLRVDDITHRCYTHVIVSSEAVRPYYAEAFGLPLERVKAVGVPRTDAFFDKAYAQQKKAEFAAAFPQAASKQVILFAPTFRGNGRESAHYPNDAIDWPALADFCRRHNAFVVVKMHPFVKDFALPAGYEDVFADASAVREVNDLLFAADQLVTDYSSVIYEAALLGLPTLFYVFDRAEYTAARDFYEPFDAYTAGGAVVETFPALLAALAAPPVGDAAAFRERSLGACDGAASERVARLIFENR